MAQPLALPASLANLRTAGGSWQCLPRSVGPSRLLIVGVSRFANYASGVLTFVSQDKTADARRSSSSKLSVLRRHPIFCDLEPEALDQLCRYAKHTSLKRGATIFSKGDPGNSVLAVISGTVKISISSSEGRNAILNFIGAGQTFGEIAVLAGQGRTADATANTDCEIFVIERRDFLPFVRSQPALAMKFIELLCARLRHTSEQVEQLILL